MDPARRRRRSLQHPEPQAVVHPRQPRDRIADLRDRRIGAGRDRESQVDASIFGAGGAILNHQAGAADQALNPPIEAGMRFARDAQVVTAGEAAGTGVGQR